MSNAERGKWVVVAQFNGLDRGLAADMAVSKLQGSAILALRLPTAALFTYLGGSVPVTEWVRVLVPLDQTERAKEILEEEGSDEEGTVNKS